MKKKLNYGVQNSILFISVVFTRKIKASILVKMKNENILTLINAVYFTLQSTQADITALKQHYGFALKFHMTALIWEKSKLTRLPILYNGLIKNLELVWIELFERDISNCETV